jgi:hypothetical protein
MRDTEIEISDQSDVIPASIVKKKKLDTPLNNRRPRLPQHSPLPIQQHPLIKKLRRGHTTYSLAVLATSKSHDFERICEVYSADQALSNSASMAQIERYLTLIIRPEIRAFCSFFKS